MFQEPVEDLAQVPSEFLISVIMERTPSQSPWVDAAWTAVGVTAQLWSEDAVSHVVTLIHEQEGAQQFLYGSYQLQLHLDECESYYHNLCSDTPRCFVIATEDDQGVPVPKVVSLSFDEAHAYLECDEMVYAVALPPELYRWCELFVLSHYVPELKKKRRLTDWSANEQGGHVQ